MTTLEHGLEAMLVAHQGRDIGRDIGREGIWVKFEQADIYIRLSTKYVKNIPTLCLQIANISMPVEYQRKGTFTRAIIKIRTITDLPIFLENTRNDFAQSLLNKNLSQDRQWLLVRQDTRQANNSLDLITYQ